MDLKHLHEFVALADTGSFARASARLSLAQSVLSKHIASLEEELGVRLFNREHKTITLSEYGALLYPYAKQILDERERCFESINRTPGSLCQTLNIGAINILRLYGLMKPIMDFKAVHPEIELDIYHNDYDLKEKLLRREIDVAFVREPPKLFRKDEQIGAIKCISDSVVAVLPTNHPLIGNGPIDLLQLQDEPFYLVDRQLPLSRLCINTCRSAGFSPKIAASGFSGEEIIDQIGQGAGVTLLAKHPFETRFGNNEKVSAVEVKQYMRTYITLIYLRDNEKQIANNLFLSFFRAQFLNG